MINYVQEYLFIYCDEAGCLQQTGVHNQTPHHGCALWNQSHNNISWYLGILILISLLCYWHTSCTCKFSLISSYHRVKGTWSIFLSPKYFHSAVLLVHLVVSVRSISFTHHHFMIHWYSLFLHSCLLSVTFYCTPISNLGLLVPYHFSWLVIYIFFDL